MRPKTDLYDLIASLSKQEKRYFALYANRQGSATNKTYLQLFEWIDRRVQSGKGYDEDRLKKDFAGQSFLKHLSSFKNYLFKLILEALENYHAGRTPEDQLQSNLRRLQILFSKGLIEPANTLLRQSAALAEKHGLLLFQLELYRWKIRLFNARLDLKAMDDFVSRGVQHQRAVLQEFDLQQQILHTYTELTLLERRLGSPRDREETQQYERVGEQLFGLTPGNQHSFDTWFYYRLAVGLYYYMVGRFEEANAQRAALVEQFHAQPEAIERQPLRYLQALSNLMTTLRLLGRFEECHHWLEALKAFEPANDAQLPANFRQSIFVKAASHELALWIDTGTPLADCRQPLEDYAREFEQLEPYLTPIEQLYLNFTFFHFWFVHQEYKTALRYLQPILNRKDLSFKRNLTDYCRILLLITHYELGNIDLLEDGMIRSTLRYFRKRGQQSGIEAFFMKMLRVIVDMPSANELLEGLAWARPRLQRLDSSPEARLFFQRFDLIAWVDSKLRNQAYLTVLLERRQLLSNSISE